MSTLKMLQEWETAIRGVVSQLSTLEHIFMAAPEAPIMGAVHGLIGAYTRAIADLLCWDESTLEDWIYTHNFGERPMQIGFKNEPLRTCSTIEDLAQFIADDLARSTKDKS